MFNFSNIWPSSFN